MCQPHSLFLYYFLLFYFVFLLHFSFKVQIVYFKIASHYPLPCYFVCRGKILLRWWLQPAYYTTRSAYVNGILLICYLFPFIKIFFICLMVADFKGLNKRITAVFLQSGSTSQLNYADKHLSHHCLI